MSENIATVTGPDVDPLQLQIGAQERTIAKLKKYIANLEADGNRLCDQLVVANSYKECFKSIAIPHLMVDERRHVNFANEAFLAIAESAVADPAHGADLPALIDCADLADAMAPCLDDHQDVKGTVCRFVSPSGRRYRFAIDAMPLKNIASNQFLGAFVVLRDIEEDARLQCMVFDLCGQQFGLDVARLKSIVPMQPLNGLPCAPSYVMGLLNQRDGLIPVIDLAGMLDVADADSGPRHSILILTAGDDTGGREVGLAVGMVSSIHDIDGRTIDSLAAWHAGAGSGWLRGVAECDGKLTVLLKSGGWAVDLNGLPVGTASGPAEAKG